MGKQGPCYHCGITRTPLWRNGPPGKPVLCNACGSRWRTKGTLENYIPSHARFFPPFDSEDSRNSREDKLPYTTKKDNWHIQAHDEVGLENREMFGAHRPCPIGFEDDTSNRSSSGSAISVSGSCVQLGSMECNDISAPVKSKFWDFHIPSKKRTTTRRPSRYIPSPVEKLRRDLLKILQEQEQEPSNPYGSYDDVLIYPREGMTFPFETDLGSVLLKPPESFKEKISEASSLLIENKISSFNETHMESSCLSVQSQNSEIISSKVGKHKLTQDIEDTFEWEGNPAKQCDVMDVYLRSSILDNSGNLCNRHSTQTSDDMNPVNNKNLETGKEISSLANRVVGGGISIPAKGPQDQPCFQTYGGSSSDFNKAFKIPKEQMDIQRSASQKGTLSSLSPSIRSSILNSMNAINAAPLSKDMQLNATSNVSCPLDGPSYYLEPKKRANLDEETKPASEIPNRPTPFHLSKNPISGSQRYPN